MSQTAAAPTKYIKFLIENNDKVARFLNSITSQPAKTAEGYGMGLTHFDKFLKQYTEYQTESIYLRRLGYTIKRNS